MLLVSAAVLGLESSASAGAEPRCPGRATVRGIDVSKWQGEVDWDAVRADRVEFAFIRVSDGIDRPDPQFDRNWREARRAGLVRGAYQYFRPAQDAEQQADLLLEMMGAPMKGDLPPVIDVEAADGVAPAEVVRGVDRWIKRVKKATGMTPIVYTSAKSWALLAGNSRRFRRHPLWIAHYEVPCPSTPVAWRRWTFHQTSQTGQVAGVAGPVDQNLFRGSRRTLARLTVKSERAVQKRWRRWKVVAGRDRANREASTTSTLPVTTPSE
jgi:lysozyme